MAWKLNLFVLIWEFGFIIQIGLTIAILPFIYKRIYFWISCGLIAFDHIFSSVATCMIHYWVSIDDDDEEAPFFPWLAGCYLTITDFHELHPKCLSVRNRLLRHFCFIISLIPILIHYTFVPIFVMVTTFKTIWKESDAFNRNTIFWISAIKAAYTLPQNILYLVILRNANIDEIVLYILLISSIFVWIL